MPRGATRASQPASGDAGPSTSTASSFEQVHKHTFLQFMMHKGWMPQQEAKEMVRNLTKSGNGVETVYNAMLAEINKDLDDLELQIKQTRFVNDGQWYVGFINKTAGDDAKMGTQLSHAQLAFFRNLMETLAMTPDEEGKPTVSSTEALNLTCAASSYSQAATQQQQQAGTTTAKLSLTKEQKQQLLKQLVAEGWISTNAEEDGYYCLGVRTFLELGHYLLELPDLPDSNKAEWEKVL